MDKKYWVPSIEKVDNIIKLIAKHPSKYRLIDISRELELNKSSAYSILFTLETLKWIAKEKDGTFSLGIMLGMIGSQYFEQFNIVDIFYDEAPIIVEEINETVQMSILDSSDIVYIGKIENNSHINLATSPGSILPAHATAMGKVHLSQYSFDEIREIYKKNELNKQTSSTVDSIEKLWNQIEDIQNQGYIWEMQESIEGFVCVAAPIKNSHNNIIAAISITMLHDKYKLKKDKAENLILRVANIISEKAGYRL